MTRVIHTGDTHLGYRQYHSPVRRHDFLAAFQQVVRDAIQDDVDAVVHAGDLFHDRHPDLPDLLGTIDALRDLRDADVPFLGVVGNHERKRDGQWLDLFGALGLATRLDHDGVQIGDTTLYGLDYVPRSQRDTVDVDFAAPDTTHTALVTHGLFEPFAHADWDTSELLTNASVDFDAVLLGDNHAPGVERVDDTWVTYCGSTERTSAAERPERGYNIVTFDEDVTITRRGIDAAREFVFVDVDLGETEGLERVLEQVGQRNLEDAVVIVNVDGDGESFPVAAVEEFATDRGALVARVTDRREFDHETTATVSFADPDEAVRDRVRSLGLSDAAREIDETVRKPTVADSNVRQVVESNVRELLDDPGAFEPAASDESDEEPGDIDGTAPTGMDADAVDSKPVTATDEGPSGDASVSDTDETEAEVETNHSTREPTDPTSGSESTGSTQHAETDGQSSMEEFL